MGMVEVRCIGEKEIMRTLRYNRRVREGERERLCTMGKGREMQVGASGSTANSISHYLPILGSRFYANKVDQA